jgi:Putative peptidoglycan binding domain/Domain of unknown function (DUF4280)
MKPKLVFYSQGKAVTELQAKLNLLMQDKTPALVVDGKFGLKTYERVKEFQVKRGLAPDGIVGAKTWAALDGSQPPPGASKPTTPAPVHNVKWTPVTNGAVVRCCFGAAPSALVVAPPGRPADVRDCRPFTNVMPFGMCMSLSNPTVAGGTYASQGVLTPMPCTPVVISNWSAVSPVQLVGPQQVPAIDKGSTVGCVWGGVISIG